VHHRPRLRPRATALPVAVPLLLVGACSLGGGPAEVGPAPRASDAACARAIAAAPALVGGRARVPLDVPGALAWGEPAIVVRCGLPALAPTPLQCVSADGVDWVVDPDRDPVIATTYGRDPAVEVRVPVAAGRETVATAVVDLGPVARALPRNGRACQG
jgi:hypothetical protein